MEINSLQGIQGLGKLAHIGKQETIEETSSFKSIFTDALNDYKKAEADVDSDINALATGETDDLHSLMINTQKAELSLDLVLQLRNKALDAYNEIMRINV